MRLRRICVVALLWAMGTAGVTCGGVLDGDGIGAYGDSMTMQYSQWLAAAAQYNVGGYTYDGTQLNWVDHLVASGYNFGPTGTLLGFPYKVYNAAVSGTSSDALPTQVDWIKTHLASKDIKTVVINIGSNDFGNGPYYNNFYNRAANPSYDPLADPDSTEVINTIVGRISNAIDATLGWNPDARFVLNTVPDLGATPDYRADHPNPVQRAAVAKVVDALNDQIIALAQLHGAPVVDLNGMTTMLGNLGQLAGIQMLYSGGHTGDHTFLSDGFHPGTVMQGFIANAVLLAHQKAWGDDIELISDQEIITRAGLSPLTTGPTYHDLSQYVIFSVPEPSGVVLAIFGGCALLAVARRRRAA